MKYIQKNKIFSVQKKTYFKTILFLIIPTISFFISINQSLYFYDGYHWGLLLYTAESFNLGEKLYKDIFVHYGILSTILEAIILKISNNNFIYIFFTISLFYSASIFILSILINKIAGYKFAILGSLMIFFIHPFAISPWHNYTLFFLFNLYLLFSFSKIRIINLLGFFLLGTSVLFSESFIYACLLILIFDLILLLKFNKKDFFQKILFFILPIFLFFIYILNKNLFSYWYVNFALPSIFVNEILNTNIYNLIVNLFISLSFKAIKNFYSEPQWLFYSILIIANLFYFFKQLRNLNKLEINHNLILFRISFFSLIFLYNSIHLLSTYKLSTGTIIGIVVLIYLIKKIKNIDNKIIYVTFFFLLTAFNFEFYKNNTNPLYLYNYIKNESEKNNYFEYFNNQKWPNKTWNNLIFLDKKLYEINNSCSIKYSVNLSSDAFYSVILRKYFILDQKIPWFENNHRKHMNGYYNTLFNHYDNNFNIRIVNKLETKNLIIVTDRENYPIIYIQNHTIKLDEQMDYIKIPYSYHHKNKIIAYPKNCLINKIINN